MQENTSVICDPRDLGFDADQMAVIRERQRAQEGVPIIQRVNAQEKIGSILERFKTIKLDPKPAPTFKPPTPAEVAEALKVAGFPARTLEDLKNLFGPGLSKAKELEIFPKIMAGDATLIVRGDCGRGKTVMAAFWARQRALAGKSPGRYITLPDLLNRIKASYQKGAKESEDGILRYYRTKPMLVLDEAQDRSHTEQSREWSDNILNSILRPRHDAHLLTVFILNCKRGEVDSRLTPQIMSRATQTGGVVNCDWESYREAKP